MLRTDWSESRHLCHTDRREMDYREAGRVRVLQKGLENNGEVVPEEAVAVQQLLESFLQMKAA